MPAGKITEKTGTCRGRFRFVVGVSGFEPEASWTRIKTHLFNIVLLSLKSIDFMRILWYHCVVKFYSVVYLFISLFTQVFTFWR